MPPALNSGPDQVFMSFIALVVASIAPAIVMAVFFATSEKSWEGILIGFFIALAFYAAQVFILGLPLLLVGVRLHAIRWWSCLLVSFLIGYVPNASASGWDMSTWPMASST